MTLGGGGGERSTTKSASVVALFLRYYLAVGRTPVSDRMNFVELFHNILEEKYEIGLQEMGSEERHYNYGKID